MTIEPNSKPTNQTRGFTRQSGRSRDLQSSYNARLHRIRGYERNIRRRHSWNRVGSLT